jgi:hypothetical protein
MNQAVSRGQMTGTHVDTALNEVSTPSIKAAALNLVFVTSPFDLIEESQARVETLRDEVAQAHEIASGAAHG